MDKKNFSNECVFIYEDESHIRDYQVLRATWSMRGVQKKIPTYGHHATVSLFGGVNVQTGRFHCMEAERATAQAFLFFLIHLLQEYPNQHIVVILDNAKIHHAKMLRPFLQKHQEQLMLIFLPPYSLNLNLAERIWGWLTESVIANHFHRNRTDLRESILSFLAYLFEFPERVLQRIGQIHMSEC